MAEWMSGTGNRRYMGQGWRAYQAAASPSALAHEAVVAGDGPHPLAELGAVAAGWERRGFRRLCHLHAIRSGQQRYPAVNHGHSEKVDELDGCS